MFRSPNPLQMVGYSSNNRESHAQDLYRAVSSSKRERHNFCSAALPRVSLSHPKNTILFSPRYLTSPSCLPPTIQSMPSPPAAQSSPRASSEGFRSLPYSASASLPQPIFQKPTYQPLGGNHPPKAFVGPTTSGYQGQRQQVKVNRISSAPINTQ